MESEKHTEEKVKTVYSDGRGLSTAALATAVPAAVVALGNTVSNWIKGTNVSPAAANTASALASMAAPLVSAFASGACTRNVGCCDAPALSAVIAEKDAKIARLEAEKYSDNKVKELYDYQVSQNERLNAELYRVNTRLTAVETAAPLREQIVDGKIAQVAQQSACGFAQTNAALNALQVSFAAITKLVVPNSSICPGWGNVTITPAAATTTTTPAA